VEAEDERPRWCLQVDLLSDCDWDEYEGYQLSGSDGECERDRCEYLVWMIDEFVVGAYGKR
jgi:hypothetical protein